MRIKNYKKKVFARILNKMTFCIEMQILSQINEHYLSI